MIRTYAAFVQNTIEPMLDHVDTIIQTAEKKGLPIDRKSIQDAIEHTFIAHVLTVCIRGVFNVVIAGIVCFTAYKVMHG